MTVIAEQGPGRASCMPAAVVVLDLDGVIVKTNLVKHDAMLALFADDPARQASVSAFILAHGGVPRRHKLTALLHARLGTAPSEAAIEALLARYAAALAHQLAAAPMVEGVEAFLASWPGPMYVCSSAPVPEVHSQLSGRALDARFAAVYGGDTPKCEALRQIADANPGRRVVFFDDAVSDHAAAQAAGVAFVAVACERDNFATMAVAKIQDFVQPAVVARAMTEALASPNAC